MRSIRLCRMIVREELALFTRLCEQGAPLAERNAVALRLASAIHDLSVSTKTMVVDSLATVDREVDDE